MGILPIMAIAGHAIDLYGDVDQEISLADGSIFNPTYFTSFKPSGDILANTNLRFVNTIINLIDDSLVLQRLVFFLLTDSILVADKLVPHLVILIFI